MSDNTLIKIFDGHNDSLLRYISDENYSFLKDNEGGHLDMGRAQKGGFAGGFFAVFIRNPVENDEPIPTMAQFKTDDGYDAPLPPPIQRGYAQQEAMRMIAKLYQVERRSEGQFKVVRTVDELTTSLETNPLTAILHFEGAEAIDENFDALETFYQAGLRSLGPVWSRKNTFAEGVPFKFPHSPDTGDGLTDAGKALIKACNALGIMIDLSHINEKGFWDVAEITDAPLVATHSNVHALAPSTRNLTDKQLDAIKESDGMVGLNFAVVFLRDDGQSDTNTPIEVMVRHIDYLVEKLGIERVGFGSDFDGAGVPNEIGDAAGLPKLIEALRGAGYDDDALRKLAHENWIRVLRKTWKA